MKGIMVLLVLGIIFVGTFASIFGGIFVDKSVAVRALDNQGFSDIRIINKDWFFVSIRGCDRSDAVKFKAIATNPAGKRVELFVCAGWPFKGATVRSK